MSNGDRAAAGFVRGSVACHASNATTNSRGSVLRGNVSKSGCPRSPPRARSRSTRRLGLVLHRRCPRLERIRLEPPQPRRTPSLEPRSSGSIDMRSRLMPSSPAPGSMRPRSQPSDLLGRYASRRGWHPWARSTLRAANHRGLRASVFESATDHVPSVVAGGAGISEIATSGLRVAPFRWR